MLLLVVSETGLVYTFTTPKLQPLVTKPEGKNLIQVSSYPSQLNPRRTDTYLQACLNAPEPAGNENGVDTGDVADSPEDVSQIPQQQPGMPRQPAHGGYMTPEQQQQAMYYQSLQQGQPGQYAGMPQMPAHQRAV